MIGGKKKDKMEVCTCFCCIFHLAYPTIFFCRDGKGKSKSIEDINKEIANVIRQITASVTFLPLIDCQCKYGYLIYIIIEPYSASTYYISVTSFAGDFQVLAHTAKDLDVPDTWTVSEGVNIPNCQEVRLRSFSTSVHKVDSMVSYKN